VVQEIRRGVVVLSDGDAVREMTVEPSPGRRSLVRSYTASVARADAGGPPESLEADSNAVAPQPGAQLYGQRSAGGRRQGSGETGG